MKKLPKIVCIGGGTGTSVVLSGLKKYPVELSAVVSMFDTGGSGGKLREELDILPMGDLRLCLVALSDENALTNLFQHRFQRGVLKGHNLGNLLIAATSETVGDFEKAIEKIRKILNVQGEVFPVTLENANLKAILKNDEEVCGEETIVNCQHLSKAGIKKLFLEPSVKANPKAILAIKNADLIVISPGKFYTSILPNFLVGGIAQAVRRSRAKKIFIANLMTQEGNTDGLSVEDFVVEIEKYLGKGAIDYVIFNTGRLPVNLSKEVQKVFPKSSFISYNPDLLQGKNFIGADVLDRNIRNLNSSDVFVRGANQRTMVLHDSDKLAKILLKLCPKQ